MIEIHFLVNQFLSNRKKEFLEKKVAQDTKEKKSKYDLLLEKGKKNVSNTEKEKIAEEKQKLDEAIVKATAKHQPEADSKYEINKWINEIYSKAKPNITTHPAKFTNPKINTATPILFYGEFNNDGYLKTGNANLEVKVDVSGNSATNTLIFELYSLMESVLKDGSRLIDSFSNDNNELVGFISGFNLDYYKFKDLCLSVFFGVDCQTTTHELIRQIYFPISDSSEDYHLLSLVTPSMLLFEVKNRIDAFNKFVEGQSIRTIKKENIFHPDGFDEVVGLTEMGFSHNEFTKMGNVSYLNVRNKGIAYLLPSLPPSFQQRQTRLPSHDFFRNSLRAKAFKDAFLPLDKLIRTDVNNIAVRQGIQNCLKFIIDQVLQRVFSIRAYSVGWSQTEHYQSLPLAQRIWLDDAHLEQREQQDDWLDDVVADFARWLLDTYEYLFKDSYSNLSDHELKAVSSLVKQAVTDDQEFFK